MLRLNEFSRDVFQSTPAMIGRRNDEQLAFAFTVDRFQSTPAMIGRRNPAVIANDRRQGVSIHSGHDRPEKPISLQALNAFIACFNPLRP